MSNTYSKHRFKTWHDSSGFLTCLDLWPRTYPNLVKDIINLCRGSSLQVMGWYDTDLVICADFSPFRRSQEYEQLFLHEQLLLHWINEIDQKKLRIYFFQTIQYANFPRPGDAYMQWWNWSPLVHLMARYLFGTKSLPESMLTHCPVGHYKQTSMKF